MDKTKINKVKTFFKEQYPHIKRMAIPEGTTINSPIHGRVALATQYNRQINDVINHCSKMSRTVLTTLYVEELDNGTCVSRVGYSESYYYRRVKPSALNEFMERMQAQYPDTIAKILAD